MRFGLCCLGVVAILVVGCRGKEEASPAAGGSFASVEDVFQSNCVRCHGASGNPKAGIDLTTYEKVMKGGVKGPIVVSGDPSGSVLVQALRGQHGKKQMPFRRNPLSDRDIQQIEAWIKAGAKQ